MNRVCLLGRLTAKPELRYTGSNVPYSRFTVAVNRTFSNNNGERETDFINIVVWRNLADNCHKFLKRGSKVAVVGNIQNRSYDATDGTKRYITEVVAEEVEFISTKNNGDEQPRKAEEVTKLEPIDDNDLPF